jgi:uncharacterized tellurite resistance protein B-like protein
MPIVAVILLTLGFWTVFWFVRLGGIDHFRTKAVQREENARQAASRESARTVTLRAIDDPRDAAIILMLLVARINGDPTREQIQVIENSVHMVFGLEQELTERMTQARFIASRADSFEQAAGVFAERLNRWLTVDERGQLVTMLEEVARLEGPSHAQVEAIETLKRRIGLMPAR